MHERDFARVSVDQGKIIPGARSGQTTHKLLTLEVEAANALMLL